MFWWLSFKDSSFINHQAPYIYIISWMCGQCVSRCTVMSAAVRGAEFTSFLFMLELFAVSSRQRGLCKAFVGVCVLVQAPLMLPWTQQWSLVLPNNPDLILISHNALSLSWMLLFFFCFHFSEKTKNFFALIAFPQLITSGWCSKWGLLSVP